MENVNPRPAPAVPPSPAPPFGEPEGEARRDGGQVADPAKQVAGSSEQVADAAKQAAGSSEQVANPSPQSADPSGQAAGPAGEVRRPTFRQRWADWRVEHPLITRIDRYIIAKFLGTYIFLIALIISIAIIFDFNERIDKFTQSNVSPEKIIFDYYLNFIPYFSNLFSPLFTFIAVIFFTSKLADNSEIIAMKSTGMSFRRLLRPYMVSAALIAVTTFFLGAYVIPEGNVARVNFENRYIKKRDIAAVENVQLQVDTGVVAFISYFDNRKKSGSGFSLDKFSGKKLVSHLTARSIQYDTLANERYHWIIRTYRIRELHGMREKITSGIQLDTVIPMEPADFIYTNRQQETMTLPELDEFIEKQRRRGAANISTFEVEYHQRFAMPFAAFILTLIGVSLSCEKRKGGMGLSLGIGLALSFSYILFQTISATFAINAGWPTMISVWLPNILYTLIAFYLYRRTPE